MSADERRRGGADEGGETGGPGAAFQAFVIMEELLDKLKLLRYEETYCRPPMSFKPYSRHYFALPTNSGEQFYNFTSLAAWLLQMCGRQFEQPQEYDDPNATISNILDELRQLNHTPDFPPSKLKTGCGDQCIWVLDTLADEALRAKSFSWKQPIYPEEETEEDNIVEDDSELHMKDVEDEIMGESDDEFEEEEHMLNLGDLNKLGAKSQATESSKPEEIMESSTDAAEWKLEVERVLPQLKLTVRSDNKDWRVHIDQMHQHQDGIEGSLKETKQQLNKLYEEISRTLEKISSREKYINNQLEHLLQEHRQAQDRLAETKERYRQGSGGVTERSKILTEVTEELERIKMEMDDRGSSMTDGAPLVKIKQALQKLKQEVTQMDIRTGVVQHILLQAKLKQKSDQNRSIANTNDDEGYEGFKGF